MADTPTIATASSVIFGMEWKDIIMTAAVVIGPLATWLISKRADVTRELKARRFNIFRQLWVYRNKLNQNYVDALNLIEVDFNGHKNVVEKYRLYMKTLNEQTKTEAEQVRVFRDRDALFSELMHEMSLAVNCEIPVSEIQKQAYVPVYHAEFEKTMNAMYTKMVELLDNKKHLLVTMGTAKETERE